MNRLEGEFPCNININDVREAIAGRDDFREMVFSDHSVFVYFLGMAKDIFPDPKQAKTEREALLLTLRRECRGIVFDQNGKVIARRFHKFFNVNETEETLSSNINLRKPFVLTEKLDGSMISPYYSAGQLRFATKAGITDTTTSVELFISTCSVPYVPFCKEWISRGFTPIFEYCNPKQPIVLSYSEESLKLITLRHMVTGKYIPFNILKDIASSSGMPLVNSWTPEELGINTNDLQSFTTFESKMKQTKNIEGFVIRFNDGQMLKIKTNWYFSLNKSLDKIRRCSERHLWISILKEEYDDIRTFLEPNIRTEIDKFAVELNQRLELATIQFIQNIQLYNDKDKKAFASYVNSLPGGWQRRVSWIVRETIEKHNKTALLQLEQDSDLRFSVRKALVEYILSNLGTTKAWTSTAVLLLGGLKLNLQKRPKAKVDD
uniref:T4 RNA ligase 1-like N-terminal domain-containing protein n=1 Tax=Arcella intermedia TaxID=1963864 RepID=A0A6B2L4J3_9EUKA